MTCDGRHEFDADCPDPECYRLEPVAAAFGTRLRIARERAEMTQADVAVRASRHLRSAMTAARVSDHESGRRPPPRPDIARAFARALGVGLDHLCRTKHDD